MTEQILSVLRGNRQAQSLVWVPTVGVTVEAMKMVNASWPEAHRDPKKLARLAASTFELTEVPCCTVPFCLTLEGEALGCPVEWGSLTTQPQIMDHLDSTFENFTVPKDFLSLGRIPVVLEAVSLLATSQRGVQPVNMKVVGPLTLACTIFGAERILIATIEEPDALKRLLDAMSQIAIELSHAAIQAGADTITVVDPVASGDLLGVEQYIEFALPYEARVFGSISVPTVLHICGYTRDLMPHIGSTGALAFSFEEKVEVKDAKRLLGDVVAIGNVAPVHVLLNGSPEDVLRESSRCLAEGVDLLAPGCAVPPLTRLQNLRAMVAATNR